MGIEEYRKEVYALIEEDAKATESSLSDAFLDYSLSCLYDAEEIPAPTRIHMEDCRGTNQRLMKIDGFSVDETDRSLLLFICDFDGDGDNTTLTMSRIDELYWRVFYYLDEACGEKMDHFLSLDSDAYKVARMIQRGMDATANESDAFLKIKFFIVTDKVLDTKVLSKSLFEQSQGKKQTKPSTKKSKKRIRKSEYRGKTLDLEIWSLDRFFEVENASGTETITIDFADYNYAGIPCLKGNVGNGLKYDAYIAIIPGKILADIYIDYGSRVLEGNVRAFLGTKSAKGVNNGIKRTINTDPTSFFTYNNGIACTAASIELEEVDGQQYIKGITDLQIINGGQTTATLAEAVLKKTNIGLDGIYVPMKLTVIPDRISEDEDGTRIYDKMIQDIARYANSQNRVTAADLFSNDPFHIWMEKSSKKYLAPPVHYATQTGWYYERSRKKYEQEQIKLHGDALKRFQAKYPKKQLINKEQLAVYLTALAGKPYIVSKGKNWVMKEFGASIRSEYADNKELFNERYFQRCVCAAIIYRGVDSYLEGNKKDPDFWYKPGGYKGNIVPYTIARIVTSIPKGFALDWDLIWRTQAIPKGFMGEVEKVTFLTNDFICRSQGLIVNEFCKKESTWISFCEQVPYKPEQAFIDELIMCTDEKAQDKEAKKEQKNINDLEKAMFIISKGADYWRRLAFAGLNQKLLNNAADQIYLQQAIEMATKGQIPCTSSGRVPTKTMAMVKAVKDIEDRLLSEGVSLDDETVKITLKDYKMH